jgi:hypothetical protein
MNHRLIITFIVAVVLTVGTLAAIFWAKGYRPSLEGKSFQGTGLLVANSYPEGASVYLNDKLTTATDDTLHLPPGQYKVRIVKDGFAPWEKTLQLEPELVAQTNARLFPSAPDLTALTFTGAINPTPSPNGQKIAYSVASASADLRNGLWVANLSDSPIKLGSNQVQLARTTAAMDFSRAQLTWSPNGEQVLVSLPNDGHFLLPTDAFTEPAQMKDVSARLSLIITEWQDELTAVHKKRLEKLPPFMHAVATASAQRISFSPDETRMMYLATEEVTIPQDLTPPLPATSTQPEERQIKPNHVYVYDLKEDKNFLLKEVTLPEAETPKAEKPGQGTSAVKPSPEETLAAIQASYSPPSGTLPQWLATSQHLVFTHEGKIKVIEYDGANVTDLFAGGFEKDFLYPWPSGNKLVILTSLGSPVANLYAINLR